MNSPVNNTIDTDEIQRFSEIADEWWNPDGSFRPLHKFNPVRLSYIRDSVCRHFKRDQRSLTPFKDLKILDVGCGGGLIAEPLARLGAVVTGIDASSQNVEIATTHANNNNINIDYQTTTPEEIVESGQTFDVVIALEVVEHVSDFDLFIDCCSALTSENGVLILATLNRTPKSFVLGIIGAEYILRWLPRGTHNWNKFVRPSEIAAALRRSDIEITDVSGLAYNPLSSTWQVSKDVSVNYIVMGEKRSF